MSWDYNKVSGQFWNVLPLDTQLEYLKEHYPIG